MAGKLAREIHKQRPFDSIQQEVVLNAIRTADHFLRGFEDLLKPHNLSGTQYNVLRILRGHQQLADEAKQKVFPGVPCKTIGEEMVTRDPDITRLLDRLETRGLIARQRDTADRRIVLTRITPEGLKVLKDLDPAVLSHHKNQMLHMGAQRLEQLCELLEMAREK